MRGHTLVELAAALALAALVTASLAPAARRYLDRAAVVAAREVTVGLLSESRLAAMASGSARVTIVSGPWIARSEVGDSLITVAALETDFGVTVELSGGRTRTEIAYNALGLGRVASETVVFRRGDTSTTLIVSSLGRARRR